jgi:membrane-associated phospholipid phosphatase
VCIACAQPACIAPLVLALWVSASRIHDYAHSAGDVTGGLFIGGAFGALLLLRTHALDARLHREAAAWRAAAGA